VAYQSSERRKIVRLDLEIRVVGMGCQHFGQAGAGVFERDFGARIFKERFEATYHKGRTACGQKLPCRVLLPVEDQVAGGDRV